MDFSASIANLSALKMSATESSLKPQNKKLKEV